VLNAMRDHTKKFVDVLTLTFDHDIGIAMNPMSQDIM
jgi:hypothetical protein